MPARATDYEAVSDTLYVWSVFEPEVKCELNCTALKLASGWVVIDPVPLADESWAELLALAPLRAILLTNGNHARGAAALRARHQAPIVTAPETRREIQELKADVTLLPGELIYGIKAIPIPGATVGETAFHSQTGIMVIGDAVINVDPARGLELLPDKYCSDARENRLSLRRLLGYDFHTLTFSHGAPVTQRAKEKLEALLLSHS